MEGERSIKSLVPYPVGESPFVAGRGNTSRAQSGSCLTVRNELSKETHVKRFYWGGGCGTQAESSRVRGPRRTALPQSQGLC